MDYRTVSVLFLSRAWIAGRDVRECVGRKDSKEKVIDGGQIWNGLKILRRDSGVKKEAETFARWEIIRMICLNMVTHRITDFQMISTLWN